MKKHLVEILIAILILVIVASFIGILINKNIEKSKTANLSEQELEYKEYEDMIINKLQNMTEIERIQLYCGEFLNFIEIGQYQKAYEKLNENFKKTYFKDLETFTNYVEKIYPKDITVEYTDFERYGDIFVLIVTISNTLDDTFDEFEQNIVVHEFGAHDYKISFDVKEQENEP